MYPILLDGNSLPWTCIKSIVIPVTVHLRSPHSHTNVSPHALRPWSILAQLKVKKAKKRTDKKELMLNKRKKEKSSD